MHGMPKANRLDTLGRELRSRLYWIPKHPYLNDINMYCTLEIFMTTRKINKDLSVAVTMFALLSTSSRKGFLKALERF
jgi:hypothetical protein